MGIPTAGRLINVLLLSSVLPHICLSSQGAENHQDLASIRMDVNAGWAKRFPQRQGVVWTYNVGYTIFKRAGLEIKVLEFPTKRAKLALARGDLDVHFSSSESFGPYQGQFIRSELPIAYLSWHIYYHTHGWQPTWPPDQAFKQKRGKSKMSWRSLQKTHGLNIKPANSVDSIIKMLHLKRIDYWLDYSSTKQLVTPGLIRSTEQGYAYQQLFSRTILGYFQNTDRGKRLKNIYQTGLIKILKQGQFNTIYYENQPFDKGESTRATLHYLRYKFPDLDIPLQHGEYL